MKPGRVPGKPAVTPEQFSTFGDLLRYLRRREELTQLELAIQVGYSDTQISRLEQNHRVPDTATLTALFVPALHLERDAEWAARLLELAREARQVELPAPEIMEIPKPKNNLPVSLTTFIGREKEQKEVMELVAGNRLVTLIGSGGVGKTRTSIQVGRQVLDQYVNGVWLVELAPLGNPELVPQAVASVFGICTQADIPHMQSVVSYLRAKKALLILDNCEHLLDACASLADTLLKSCAQLSILATSREALAIPGEMQYRLPSLGVPDRQHALAQFRDSESMRLFEERARLAQPDFKLTPENALSVAQICSRLDGIPLAIELAAARVNIFSTEQIAARLDDRFNLLTSGSRTALPRQQTIRASIDWSWNLISDPERALLRRLTVFSGGWTLEAAESVCSTESGEGVLGLLTHLVSRSLVIASQQPGSERRFLLHETIRQYAYEKLVEAGEVQDMRTRHLNYYFEFAKLTEPALHGPQQTEWYSRLKEERGNIRAALTHASKTDVETGLYLFASLYEYWRNYELLEGLNWSTALLQDPDSRSFPLARAKASCPHGQILIFMQQFEAARPIAEECLAYFRARGDRQGEYDSLILMGDVLQYQEGMEEKTKVLLQALELAKSMEDVRRQAEVLEYLAWDGRDPVRGRAYRKDAIALFRRLGDWLNLARTLSFLGFFDLSNGDLEAAQKSLDEAAEINQQINDRQGLEFILSGKSQLCLLRGEYKQARALMQENIDILEEGGNRMGYLWGRARLANIALVEGNLTEAHQLLVDVIDNFNADRNKSGLVFAFGVLAGLFIKLDQPEAAAKLIGWSDATLQEIGERRMQLQQDDVDRNIAAIKAKIGIPLYEAEYQSGRRMTLDEAVHDASGISST